MVLHYQNKVSVNTDDVEFWHLVKDMLKYEIIFRVSLCSTACMRRGISTSDGCETPHDYSFKPKWNLKVIFSSKQNTCHKLLWNLSFHDFLYRQLELQRTLSLTDRWDRSIYFSTAQSRVQYRRILYGYLESWLFGQVTLYWKETLFNQSAARATFLQSLCYSRLVRNEQRDLAEIKAVGE